ncbi:tyrosine-type recombinase/integrase [Gordonia sp. SL306]|uniref:tyrosine-type recombinase/integrase n=1 Tax=Gordonia sp. SL306 TaxID=2995145 RepID=UPI00227154A4|nr:site-specific integrase [Gordonia sp. SL306]WAC54979.1 site-specific integrase [Gordonia sp. SL306]
MASIKKYSTAAGDRYRVRYRKPDGTQTDRRGFATKKAAEVWAADNTVSLNAGTWVDPRHGKTTVGELGEEWLARRSRLKRSARQRLVTTWEVRVKPRWEHTPIADIRPTQVQAWLDGLTIVPKRDDAEPRALGATGVIYAHQVLNGILADAVRDRMLTANPCSGMTLPRKGQKRKVYLTHETLHRFVDEVAAGSVDAQARSVLVLTLGYTGLRWGEATGLRVRGVNALRRRLVIRDNAVEVNGEIEVGTTKGHRERTVPVPEFLMARIVEQCEGKGPDDLVWAHPGGGYLPLPPYTRGWWQQAVKRAEIPRITPHDLRHTAASLAVSAGANVKALQKMLGHVSAAMTLDVYADLFDDDLDDVSRRLDEAVGRMWANGGV